MDLTFNQWVFRQARPKMFCKPMANGTFFLVPFNDLAKGRNPNWQYALVNKDLKMYQMLFNNEDEVIDALFKAKEICYGTYPADAKPNPLYGRKDEMLVKYDLKTDINIVEAQLV